MSSKSSESPAADVASPCRRQCCLDPDDVCLGCGRRLTEILQWASLDGAGRRAVCAAASARLARRQGGR
ncbi:DUF1289 domain-containing protein [Pseudomonas sp. 5P_3.1_Bac2]|nr:DUF1289 domain-containing protein [Pseudomonas sp. 5P_3.1_Bac2]MCU1718016.1 DUF1289 domain-containing protein [Pseudomonas sp. 5P_3.1_Bac2]